MRSGVAWLVVGVFVLGAGAASAAPPGPAPGDGARTVRGEVSTVNEARGTLTLKTAGGALGLRFPPAAVKGIRKGDHVVVRLAVVPGPADPRPRKTAGAPAENGKRPMAPKMP